MPSAGGARNDLHISESGFREDGLWYEAALPARPLSPYAAAGFQLSPPPHVRENDGVDLRGRAQDVVGHGLCGDDVPLQGRLRASWSVSFGECCPRAVRRTSAVDGPRDALSIPSVSLWHTAAPHPPSSTASSGRLAIGST